MSWCKQNKIKLCSNKLQFVIFKIIVIFFYVMMQTKQDQTVL